MNTSISNFRDEVHQLAQKAFHSRLISGYGDSEYADKYQIIYQGKPRHIGLKSAYVLLSRLIQRSPAPKQS